MPDPRDFDTLTPELRVRIADRDLPVEVAADLIVATVVDDVNANGMFNISLYCWDEIQTKVKWIDDDIFTEGNAAEVQMGYRDNLETLFYGEITGLESEFPAEAPPTLTVRGYDRRHRLTARRKTRTFLGMRDSEIANQVAEDWSLRPEVEDTGVILDYVIQHNQTDLEFLQGRAQRIGYEIVVEDRTLYFRRRRNDGSAVLTLRREVELLDFHVRLTTVGQVEEISIRGWSPKNKEEIVARTVTGSEGSLMSGSNSGPAAARQVVRESGSVAVDQPVQDQSEADQLADGWFREMALRHVIGEGMCIGRPDLRAGTLVEIEGLGQRFSGSYYVTSTEHIYRPNTGYRTAFTVRRNAT